MIGEILKLSANFIQVYVAVTHIRVMVRDCGDESCCNIIKFFKHFHLLFFREQEILLIIFQKLI